MAASLAVSRNGACTNIWDVIAWEAALDDYFAEHNEIRLDGDARSAAYLSIDESPEAEQHLWHVRQI
ncbi:MAG: DUF3516 domain-containing protein, partial [Coriobacteriaceae bacterium]|nr:DUF3516 domain-containing protein [Coriobacteriaceae bacterium]